MRVFISSTFRDLQPEREAVKEVLYRAQFDPWGMESFVAEPTTPLEVALRELSLCDAVVLIIGFKAGSLVPEQSGLTYTGAEFQRTKELGRPIFAFIKTEGGNWVNKETTTEPFRTVLDDFKVSVEASGITPTYFETVEKLEVEVLLAFQQWNDRGRPGARRTFTTVREFFAPWAAKGGAPKLFDFEQTLYGRDTECEAFKSFLDDSSKAVAFLLGRGGVGKSKFLRDWSSGLDGWQVLFVRDGAVWHSESFKEIPTGSVLIIADDAHRQEHLDKLLALVKQLCEERNIKVILSARPSGSAQIDSQVARRFDPSEVHRIRLERLATKDVRALASEVLGPSHQRYSLALAALSVDTPLVTVVGGRLIARGDIPPTLLANEEEFRRSVFDKLSEEYEQFLPASPVPWRPLLNLIAAIGPLYTRSDLFLDRAERLLDRRRDEILTAIDILERHGLLLRGGNLVRIVPDVLSDYILESACLNEKGEPTGYTTMVFNLFGQAFLANLLRNFAELDWRIAHKYPAAGLLDSVWSRLTNDFEQASADRRMSLLKSIQNAAIFQPDQSMRIARFAMENEAPPFGLGVWKIDQTDVLRELIPVLKVLFYHSQYADESVKRLWSLAKRDVPGPLSYSKDVRQTLLQIAEYDLHKPLIFNDRIADIATALAQTAGAYDGEITPLDIADKLLEKEGEHNEIEGHLITLGGFLLNYSAIRDIRAKAIGLIDKAVKSNDSRAASRAVKSLSAVLSHFHPKFARRVTPEEHAWQDEERLQALDIIGRRLNLAPLPVALAWSIKKILRQSLPRSGGEPLTSKSKKVMWTIPQSDTLIMFDAFCTSPWERDVEYPTWEEADRCHRELVEQGVRVLRTKYPTVDDQIAALERMAHDTADYGINVGSSAPYFVEKLCDDPTFLLGFAEYLLSNESTLLGHLMSVAVRKLRSTNVPEYRRIGLAAAAHSNIYVAHGAANAISYGGTLDSPCPDDVEILSQLAKHPHEAVRRATLDGIGVLGKTPSYTAIALQLLLDIEIGEAPKLADAMCEAIHQSRIRPDTLTQEQVGAFLDKMIPVPSLNEY